MPNLSGRLASSGGGGGPASDTSAELSQILDEALLDFEACSCTKASALRQPPRPLAVGALQSSATPDKRADSNLAQHLAAASVASRAAPSRQYMLALLEAPGTETLPPAQRWRLRAPAAAQQPCNGRPVSSRQHDISDEVPATDPAAKGDEQGTSCEMRGSGHSAWQAVSKRMSQACQWCTSSCRRE